MGTPVPPGYNPKANIYEQIAWNAQVLFGLTLALLVPVGIVLCLRLRAGNGGGSLVLALAYALILVKSYYKADKLLIPNVLGLPADPSRYQPYVNTVEALALAAGIPVPKAYVAVDRSPNAFSTGLSPSAASILVTTGLLDKLDRTQLEGVVAHEIAHIRARDARVMAAVVMVVALTGILSFNGMGGMGRSFRELTDKQWFRVLVVGLAIACVVSYMAFAPTLGWSLLETVYAIFLTLGLPLFLWAFLTQPYIAAERLAGAVARRRDLLADSDAALLTRFPAGLASALAKINADRTPLKCTLREMEHIYLVEPRKARGSVGAERKRPDPHPPIDDRIARLRAMAENAAGLVELHGVQPK